MGEVGGSSPSGCTTFKKSSMKILVVEDSEDRNQHFRQWLQGHDFSIVLNAEDGIRQVHAKKYDVIFLDHDLGDRSGVPSDDPNTGYAVAKEIPNSINRDAQVIVHSMNPVGSQNILNVLSGKATHRVFGNWIEAAVK